MNKRKMEKFDNSIKGNIDELVTTILAYEVVGGLFRRKKAYIWGHNKKEGYVLSVYDYETGNLLKENKFTPIVIKNGDMALTERDPDGRYGRCCTIFAK